MHKLLHVFVMVAVIAGMLSLGGLPTAPAQKNKDKEEIGTVVIYEGKDGWRFRIQNAKGQAIAVGTVAYKDQEDCDKAVAFVKSTMAKGELVISKEKKDNKKDK